MARIKVLEVAATPTAAIDQKLPTVSAQETRWLLLHGAPLGPAAWGNIAKGLSASEKVFAPRLVVERPLVNLQTALAQWLCETLPGEMPFDVVGHSFGGQVAVEFALLAPTRVRSLMILCSRDTPFAPFTRLAANIRQGRSIDTDAVLQRWFHSGELQENGNAVRYARQCLLQADPLAYAAALEAIAVYDRASRSADLRMPVKLLAAEDDAVSSPAVMVNWAARLPHASFACLRGAAHMSPFVQPQRLLALMRAHVQSSTPPPQRSEGPPSS